MGVVLEADGEEGAEEVERFPEVTLDVTGVDGLIVFVDQQNHPLAGGAVQPARQVAQGRAVNRRLGRARQHGGKIALFFGVEQSRSQQETMLAEKLLDLAADAGQGLLEAAFLDVAKGEKDHRITLEVGAVTFARPPDLEVLEKRGKVLGAPLEEAAQHRQIERLAKTPGARQKQNLDALAVDHFAQQARLVDINPALLPQLPEVADADRNRQNHGRVSMANAQAQVKANASN